MDARHPLCSASPGARHLSYAWRPPSVRRTLGARRGGDARRTGARRRGNPVKLLPVEGNATRGRWQPVRVNPVRKTAMVVAVLVGGGGKTGGEAKPGAEFEVWSR
ncbi:hypothetical protein Drorol1_Dr00005239 [Drosera rotundifolia]